MNPAYTDRIFQPFQRLHDHDAYSGTGIGLAVCRKVVERHGGTLTVDTSPNEGSTFSFDLAAAEAEADDGGTPSTGGKQDTLQSNTN